MNAINGMVADGYWDLHNCEQGGENCPKCGEKMKMTAARLSRYWAGRMVETWTCPECEWTETREERRWD